MIDLRSDTVTEPTEGMRKVMAAAAVGDDVFQDDPTVAKLEAMMAEMTGKADALFVPSGTMSNLVALLSHCQRGEEYIVGQGYHTYWYEAGGAPVLGSIVPQPIMAEKDGTLDLAKVSSVIKEDDSHFARTKLLCLENTHNGKVISLEYMKEAFDFAKSKGLSVHLDGARAFNAIIELSCDLKELTQYADSVSICLSKGLGAPVGSVLCADKDIIKWARRWRKMVGGGMRQSGVLAAAGIYALENHVERLAMDHANAKVLAKRLQSIPQLSINMEQVETNMLFVKTDLETATNLANYLKDHNIIIIPSETMRWVMHLDVSSADVKFGVSKSSGVLYMIVYFAILFLAGLFFYYLSGKMARTDFKQNELKGVRTPETLADEQIWTLVNTKAAVFYRQFSFGMFALAFMSLLFAKGILPLMIFIALVILVSLLMWRYGQLKQYAKELYLDKYNKELDDE